MPQAAPRSPWLVPLGQFKSILILIDAALLSASIGSFKDAVVILAVVVINALVGFYQELRRAAAFSGDTLATWSARHPEIACAREHG